MQGYGLHSNNPSTQGLTLKANTSSFFDPSTINALTSSTNTPCLEFNLGQPNENPLTNFSQNGQSSSIYHGAHGNTMSQNEYPAVQVGGQAVPNTPDLSGNFPNMKPAQQTAVKVQSTEDPRASIKSDQIYKKEVDPRVSQILDHRSPAYLPSKYIIENQNLLKQEYILPNANSLQSNKSDEDEEEVHIDPGNNDHLHLLMSQSHRTSDASSVVSARKRSRLDQNEHTPRELSNNEDSEENNEESALRLSMDRRRTLIPEDGVEVPGKAKEVLLCVKSLEGDSYLEIDDANLVNVPVRGLGWVTENYV